MFSGGRGSAYYGSLLLQVRLTRLLPLIPARHLQNFNEALKGYRKRHLAADPKTSDSDKLGLTQMSQRRWWRIRDASLGMESPGTAYWL